MKRLLFSVLVAAMVVGLGGTAFAALPPHGDGVVQPPAFTDIAGHEAEGELTLLGAMGVFTGDAGLGGAVKPDDPITRAQFCKVLVAAMGRGSTAAGLAGLQPTFTDGATIPTWAWGSVNVAVYMGIINGYADGSFGPNNPVTYAEAVTMLIRAVPGHAAQVGAGIWPYNFLFYGVDNGFVGGVDVGFANLPCTRGDMARMLVATMQQNKLDSKGVELDAPPTAVLQTVAGTMIGYAPVAVGIDGLWGGLADKVWIAGAKDLAGLMGLPVVAALDSDHFIFCLWLGDESSSVSGVVADPLGDADDDGKADCFVLADGTKVPYAEDTHVPGTINHNPGQNQDNLEEDGGDEITIAIGPDGLAVSFVAVAYDSIFMHEVTANKKNSFFVVQDIHPEAATYKADDPATWGFLDSTDHIYSSLGPVPHTCQVTLNGAPATFADLKKGDVIDMAVNWNDLATIGPTPYYVPISIRAHREVVEGTVAATSTTYGGGSAAVDRVTLELAAGGTKTFVVDPNGTISGLPGKGWIVKYGLDFAGNLLAEIGYETITPFVVVQSFQVNGDGTATATVDVRGKDVTYKVADNATLRTLFQDYAEHEHGLWIEVDTATNTIVDVADFVGHAPTVRVVLANAGGNLTLGNAPVPTVVEFVSADSGYTLYTVDEDDNVFYMDPATVPVTTDSTPGVVYYTAADESYGFDDGPGAHDDVPAAGLFVYLPHP